MYFYNYNVVVWGWDEFNYFYSVPYYNITSKFHKSSNIFTICPFKVYTLHKIKKKKNISFSYIWCELLVDMIEEKQYLRKIEYYFSKRKNDKIMNYIYFLYYYIFNRLLCIKKNIIYQVNNFLKKFKYINYIGLQIRVGNADLKERQRSTIDDIKKMIYLANQIKHNKWFLTADSIKLKLNLSKIYQEIFLYSTNLSKHFARNLKDSSIVIEHEILSRSKYLIISKSTYGLTASLKSGLLNLKKDAIHVVKYGKIYNLKNEFKSFYC